MPTAEISPDSFCVPHNKNYRKTDSELPGRSGTTAARGTGHSGQTQHRYKLHGRSAFTFTTHSLCNNQCKTFKRHKMTRSIVETYIKHFLMSVLSLIETEFMVKSSNLHCPPHCVLLQKQNTLQLPRNQHFFRKLIFYVLILHLFFVCIFSVSDKITSLLQKRNLNQ